VPIIYLQPPLVKIIEDTVVDGLKVEDKNNLSVKWMDVVEPMTQEEVDEVAGQDIHGCA